MKKICIFLVGLFVFLITLAGCGIFYDEDNPLSGKNTDERIIMALEKAYPGHDFKTVKEYGKHGGEYYAVCADENGLEFRVTNILYNNTYHFGCYDEYMKEVLMRQDFLGKASEIAEKRGYKIEYDKDNVLVGLDINVSNHDVEADDVAECLADILHSVSVPEVHVGDEVFSTGEVNYYTVSKLRVINYHFVSENGDLLAAYVVEFADRDSGIEELSQGIQVELDRAYENLEARQAGAGEIQ